MTNTNKPSIVFWIVGVIALLWNLLGVNAYIQQVYRTEGFLEAYTAEELALMDASPAWITALFAIAVFAGAIGSLLLLLRKKLAASLLLLSFLAALIQMGHYFFATEGPATFETIPGTVMPIFVVVFAAFLVWYSKDAKKKGILS